MISYNNSDVVQSLRQYEMFANSLNLVKNKEQRDMIIKQLTKLEEKIISLTEEIYEEEYAELANKKCSLFADEKNRINMLIELINQRLSYVEKRCNNHYELTGESINVGEVHGASSLDELEERVKIIDKYIKNMRLEKELEEEVKSLTDKIALASEKIEINKSLNVELEATFKKVIAEAISKLELDNLLSKREDIEYAYSETTKSLDLAGRNLEMAKTSPANILTDCQVMYNEILKDYDKYREQMCILKLIDSYEEEVNDYDSLLEKRKMINEIIKYIGNEELLDMIMDTITKQFNTIVMEGQDINTYGDLVIEKDRKQEALNEINNENNSEKFQSVLSELIENEKKRQEKILEEQRKIEEEEKQRKLELERRKQEEILKRQRIIEEARKKEMEKRTKKMLEEQQNSVLQGKKKEKEVSFETIKDNSLIDTRADDIDLEKLEEKYDLNTNETDEVDSEVRQKNKVEIEKELFEEFNSKNDDREEVVVKETEPEETSLAEDLDSDIAMLDREEIDNNINNDYKLPDMSLDEYMRNFDESKVDKANDMFDDDVFPTIPL